MQQKNKTYSLLVFIGLLLSVPMNNYLHVLQHQQDLHKVLPHQCSDYIHFGIYVEPDNTETQPSPWMIFAEKPYEDMYTFGMVLRKVLHKSYVRGPPIYPTNKNQPYLI